MYILEIVESISLLYPWADILQHLKPLLVLLVALLMLVLEHGVPAELVSHLSTDPFSPCNILARPCDRQVLTNNPSGHVIILATPTPELVGKPIHQPNN